METMRRFALGITAAALVGLPACGDDDGNGTTPPPPPDNPPTMQMTAPAGGAAQLPGSTLTITWTATDDNAVTGVDLSYTADGVSQMSIATGVTGSSFDWTLPSETLYGVRVQGVARDAANQTATDETTDIFAVVPFSAAGYVTSEVCADCHQGTWNDVYLKSGHPYKLNKVEGGMAPTYPNSSVPNPPAGFTWDDVTYVIGGYGWKARFIGVDGYIITAGGLNQYNLATQGFVDYHKDELKPYDCGQCHTTGWVASDDGNAANNQDGLEGLFGTFEEQGISCEACHGAGVDHVSQQVASEITIDRTPEQCGSCHQRGGLTVAPEASGGFIRHHEQYNEWAISPHGSGAAGTPDCVTCHSSHIGTSYGNAALGGIIADCQSCHGTPPNAHVVAIADCETCHMAQATKSAVAAHAFEGDVKTHIFRINPDPVGKDAMWFDDAGKLRANAFVTLDFVCYQCHTDPNTLAGGGFSQQSLAELSARATGIHN